MTKLKKTLASVMAVSVALVMTAGIACLTINCSSDESGRTLSYAPAASELYEEIETSSSDFRDNVTNYQTASESDQKILKLTEDHVMDRGGGLAECVISANNYLTIDLNGHNLIADVSFRAFNTKGTLTIIDSSQKYDEKTVEEAGENGIEHNADGSWTVTYYVQTDVEEYREIKYTAGSIWGGSYSFSNGGPIYLFADNDSTINFNGGIIHSYEGVNGGAVYALSGAYINMNGGVFYGNTVSNYGGAVELKGATFNMNAGAIVDCGASYGGAVYGCESATVNLGAKSWQGHGDSAFDTAYVSGCTTDNSGTFYLTDSAVFNSYENAVASFNEVGNYGSLVYSSSCDVTVSGSLVTGNTAGKYATMYVKSGNVKFDGPTFLCNVQNSTSCGGLALFATASTAEIVGGTYAYGSGAGCGGAFDTNSAAVMSISDAEIYGNSSSKGGGVYAGNKSTVTLTNVYIHDNQASTYGGGVYEESTATLTISDSVITGNTAGTSAAGIYALNSVSVSGRTVVNGNSLTGTDTEENVLLAKDMYVTLDEVLSVGSHIGITFANGNQTQVTSAESSTTRYKSSCQYFYLDEKGTGYFFGCAGNKYVELVPNSSAVATVTWAGFETADPERFDSIEGAILAACVTDETHVGTAKPLGDVDVSSTITVPEGFYAALDLGGKTVTWAGSSQSNFFIVYGNFTLLDSEAKAGEYSGTEEPGVYKVSSTSGTQYMTVYGVMDGNGDTSYFYYQSGAITGGMATYKASDNLNARGGGFYVASSAVMTMYGGTIYANTSTYGGGVHTYGAFTMYGGAISENISQNSSSSHNGAAILVDTGTLDLYGGVLYGNTTTGNGYGGAVENNGTLTIDNKTDENTTYAGKDLNLGAVISGNYSSAYGGAIFNRGTLIINGGYITLNSSKSDGGAINSNGGPVYMYGGYITGNTSGGIGGGVCSPSSFYMYGGHINNNTASSYGGGIYTASTSYFYGGEIAGNTAAKYGGGISTISTLHVGGESAYTITVSGNTASTNGGGIYSSSSLYIYSEATISGNTASDSGGGVYGTSKIYIYGGKISGNTAKNYGGGVYASSSATIEMTGGEISDNEATSSSKGQGAGIAVYGTATMSGGTISNNTAGYYGGALIIADGATFTMSGDAIMSGNSAPRAGAVSISGKGSKLYMYGGTISDNIAKTGNGAGVYVGNSGTYFTMEGGTISGNTAADCAGGVFCNDNSTVKLLGGEVTGNHAKNSGAGVYYVSSASVEIGGGLVVKENALTDAANEDYDNDLYVLSGTKITVDGDLSGEVYIFADAAPSFQLSSNSFTKDAFISAEISSRLISVQGYCVGLNSSNNYIYVYEKDDPAIIYVGIETDEATGATKLVASYYCSQCFQSVGDCSNKIEYVLNDDGSATAYVEETGCTCYGLGAPDEEGVSVVEEGGAYLNTGVLLDDGSGNVTWYPDVESAFAAATGDCTVTLLGGITLSEDGVLNLEADQNITLDLNGHTIDGDVEVSGSGSLTITDSRGGGAITGNVSSDSDSTQITISVSGGTYSEDSFESLTLADGFYGLCSKAEGGSVTYTVYSKDEMETIAVAYIAKYDDSCGEIDRIYYSLLGDAVICAGEGETVTLCRNLDMSEGGDAEESLKIDASVGNVTIDLNGFVLTADITIEAVAVTDSAADPTVSLTVNDSSEDKTGRISGKITVTGTSSDNDLGTGGDTDTMNSFEKTLVIAATAVDSSLEVNTEELRSATSASVEYSFSAITDENGDVASYGITKGHDHIYSIAEAYEDEQGNIKIKIKCSCGNYYRTGNGDGNVDGNVDGSGATVFDLPGGTAIEAVENDDGTVTYYIDEFAVTDAGSDGNTVGTFTADYTVTPFVKIEIRNSDGTTETIYLDENTIGTINTVISGASSVTITLWDNVDLGEDVLAVADCDVTIDLAGYSFSGNIIMSSTTENTASLEVTDSSSIVITETGDGDTETSYVTGTGVFDGTISVSGDSDGTKSLTVSGGTYSSDAVTSIETAFGGMESCLPEYNSGDGTSVEYAVIYNLDGSATVTTADNALSEAAVTVKIGDTEMYFSSVQAAVNYLESDSTITDATITLLADCEEDIEIKSGSVSMDLNGNTLYGNVKVDGNATLTLSDSSEGEGHVEGSISGAGKVEGEIIVAEITDGESNYYYTGIETAASALKDGDTLVILRDLGEDGDPVYINVTVEGGVTIDLNGNTVYGDVTSSEGTSLTMKDSAAEDTEAGNDGILVGAVSGNSVTITSGTYTQDVGAYVADGKVMLVVTTETEDGNTGKTAVEVTYTVVDGSTVPGGAVVSVTGESGNVTYYTDIDTAVASVGFGETITLLGDVTGDLTMTDAGVFTIDLNGNTITGDVTVSGNTALTITDSTEYSVEYEGFGGITGSVEVNTESGATLTIEAGIYSSDVTGYEADDKVVLVIHDGGDGNDSYMVLSEDEAKETAVASVTYTDADGNERTFYFSEVSEAIACACENSASESPATVTLYKDVGEDDNIQITAGNVILDMNGYTVNSDITVTTEDDAEGETSFTITGEGTYKGNGDISGYVEEGLAAYVTEGGTLIVDEEYAEANASVSVTVGDTTIYFDDIYAAVEYVNGLTLEEGSTATLTLLKDVTLDSTGDKDTITFTSDVTLDLNGQSLTGNVQAGDGTDTASVVIEDSSAEDGKGEGFLGGDVSTGTADGSSVTVTGGTFTGDGVQSLLGEGCVAVVGADGNTVVVAESDLNNVASASVTTEGGTTYMYYESLDAALAAAAEVGGTVKLLQDAEMTGKTVEISTSVTIDLNGHTAEVDISLDGDTGSLTICDSSVVDGGDAGTLTGTIKVTGDTEESEWDDNPYDGVLTMKDGVAPNGDLTIDLTELGADSEYFFDAVTDETTGGTTYGIVKEHEHAYNIEVWTFTEGGGFTLDYMCACGEMWEEDSIVADVGVEIDEDGNFVFTATAIGADGQETNYKYTADIVATVTVDGERYYFETLEAALDFTTTVSGSTLALQQDCDEVAYVTGNVTIDLNGYDLGGISAEDGSSVTVTGDGYVSSLVVEENASARLRGGTYCTGDLDDVETCVDRYNGYTVYVDAEGNVSVVDENYAKMNSAASVTDSDGNVTYYETLDGAVDALGDGDTLTLYSDASDETITIDEENITIDLNNSNLGGLVVESGASATIAGNGEVGAIDGTGDLDICGGTYGADDLEELENLIDSDYAILVGAEGSYTVLTKEDAEERSVVSVTFTDGDEAVTLYFEDMQTALAFAAEVGGTTTLTSDYSGDISLVGDMTLDLAGHTVEGDIEVANGVSATICDSVGSGVVTGEIVAGDDSTVSVTGGTYYDEEVESYVADGYIAVAGYDGGGNAVYTVMTESEAMESAAACVEFADGTVGYYESAADAIAAAIENGGKITLLDDVDLGDAEYTITDGLVIDLNGHTIYGNLVVDTDEGGSLEVIDSSEDNSGSMEGTIKVTGSGETEYTDNPYENALVFSDGATPNGNLTIDLDELESGETAYVFADAGEGKYAISDYSTHVHVYDIAVWEYDCVTGTVTVKFMCACGAYEGETFDNAGNMTWCDEYTIAKSDVTVTVNGNGTATVTCSYVKEVKANDGSVTYETYDCVVTIDVAASVTGENGKTYYFETFEEALAYACETNGTLVLNGDVTDAAISVGGDSDVTIDLAGHTLEGSVYVFEGSTLRVTDSSEDGTGLLEATLEVDGTLIVDGASLALTESNTVGDSGGIIFTGDSSVDLGGNTLTGVTGIDGNLDVTGGTGSKIVLADDVEIPGGSFLSVDGDLTIDVNGRDFAGDINVSDGSSLTIIDSTGANSGSYEGAITLGDDSYLMMEDDTYSEDAEIVCPEGMVMQSTTGSDGEPAYEVVSESDHVGKGHGLDKVKDYTFNAETSTITIEFECMCGETIYRTVPVTEADYTTSVVDVDGVKMVRVEYSLTSTEQGDNGTTYSYSVSGYVEIDMYTEGEDDDNYSFAVAVHATCETEGEEVYTYGQGKGVIVRVTTPKDHDWVSSTYTDGNDNELPCYKCGTCGRVVLSEGEENEYDSEDALASDIETQEKFDDAKSGILGDLREEIDKLLSDLAESLGEDSDEYKAVEEAVEEVYEEYKSLIESTDYEAKTGDDDDRETYLAELESVLNETLVEATQTSYEVSTEYMVDALYQEILESGKYDEAAIGSLGDIFYELVSDLGKITVDGIDGMKDIYDAFYDRAQAALNGVSATTAFSTEDSDYSGSVESTEGMSSSVDLEIIEIDSASVVADMNSYVYVGDKDLTEDDIAGLVEGKGVAAVFEISLKDTASGTYVYRYKGTYVVSIKLSDELLSYGGLQVIYIGADGRAEIYDTTVTDDGYLVFTTTHFSEFIILSSDVESDTDVDAGEEVPAVPGDGAGESGGTMAGKRSGKPPVEIMVVLAIIAACALAIIIIMCESSKSGKKS